MTAALPFRSSFTLTPLGDRTTAEISGDLNIGNRQQFKQLMLDELARGQKHLVIDFAKCPYIDSSGLGVLVSVSKRTRDAGGTIRLANLNDDLLTLFELTGLNPLFEIGGIAR
jgi:anti-sigma B factor antagonist